MPLKILAWNIHEGIQLQRVADEIRSKAPDIVLLNEVLQRRWFWQTDQTAWLSDKTSLPYYAVGKTVMMGLAGWKCVAVLSAHQLGRPVVHRVMNGSRETTYAMLDVDTRIGNVGCRLLSLRFDAWNGDDNIAGHRQLANIVRQIDTNTAVIVGGDFNASPEAPQMAEFRAQAGLTDALIERPDPNACTDTYYVPAEGRIDYVFYRGPYTVTRAELRCPWPSRDTEASDHPLVFIELGERPRPPLQQFLQPVTTQPAALPLGTPVLLNVIVRDAVTGSPVPSARVRLVNYDAQNIRTELDFEANTPVRVTLRRQRLRDHSQRPPQWVDGEYPAAAVSASGYADANVQFNWPT